MGLRHGQRSGGGRTCRIFDRVIATDASEKQIANAEKYPGVEYFVATAKKSGLTSGSVALVTVAQALHWFDLAKFFAETQRVLQRDGILAVWTYNLFQVSPEIDAVVENFYRETVGKYWGFERQLVDEGYRSIPFPWKEITPPNLQMTAEWSLEHALGYVRTWSATKSFIKDRGFDPVDSLAEKLRPLWNKTRPVNWSLTLLVRRKED